jgi:hypothetical protein
MNQLKQYNKSIKLLKELKILPYEHATEGRKIYTNAYVGSALNHIYKNEISQAQSRLETALQWPEHLGVGKPFDPEERWERFLLAHIHYNKGNQTAAQSELKSIANFSEAQLFRSSKNHLLGIYALQNIHGKKEAQQFIAHLLATDHATENTTQALIQFYYKNPKVEWNKKFVIKLAAFLNSI